MTSSSSSSSTSSSDTAAAAAKAATQQQKNNELGEKNKGGNKSTANENDEKKAARKTVNTPPETEETVEEVLIQSAVGRSGRLSLISFSSQYVPANQPPFSDVKLAIAYTLRLAIDEEDAESYPQDAGDFCSALARAP